MSSPTFTAQDMREIVQLQLYMARGGYSETAAARYRELTGGSPGDLVGQSRFSRFIAFSYDPETFEVVSHMVRDDVIDESQFTSFTLRQNGRPCELWGVAWEWQNDAHAFECIRSINRPKNAPVGDMCGRIVDEARAADDTFVPNAMQKVIIENYGEGDYIHLLEIKGRREFRKALSEVGDTLFQFLIIETMDSEDCTDFDEALRRLESARNQVEKIEDNLEQASPPAPSV